MILVADPKRVRPVDASAHLIRGIMSSSIRALVLPAPGHGALEPDDMLWVREPIVVEQDWTKPNSLCFTFAGAGPSIRAPWPRAVAKPGPGFRPAHAMPLDLSRLTLVVEQVTVVRLSAVPEHLIFPAGVTGWDGAFRHALMPEPFGATYTTPIEALEAMWDLQHGYGSSDGNPEVAVVAFQAISRNIRKMVPGLGHGGVR